jgi:predicted dehydrogenase
VVSYRAAIIGAGRIGAQLDDLQSPHILTHAHGFKACGGFEIVGFVDRDLNKAESASVRWGGRPFDSIERLFAAGPVDVVSICVPDELHYEALVALAEKPVKFIFLEKPAVRTAQEAREIRALYQKLPIRVLVNYTRRFVPEVRTLARIIMQGSYGTFLTGTGYYGKGLLHNGSHMLDLLRFLLGEIDDVTKLGETADCYRDDPSVSALITMSGGGVFHFRHVDCRKFEVFELDLIFERKRIRIHELGTVIEEYSVEDNGAYQGYRTLNKQSEYATDQRRAMYHAVANIRNNLERDEPLACTLGDSLETVATCLRIRESGI